MKTILTIGLAFATLIPTQAQGLGQPAAIPDDAPHYARQPARQPSSDSFSAGLLSEEGEGDLAAAAAAYRQTIQAFDRQRAEAANAIFRLGEVYRKIGALEEAKVQYARILREFPDMVRLTEISHNLLFGDVPKPGSGGSGLGGVGLGVVAMGAAAVPETGEVSTPDANDPADPGYYERLIMKRYGLVPGRMGATQPQPAASATKSSAREKSERIACVSNLKQLGLAARIYSTEHEGVFPSEVGLMSNEISVTKVLVCPSDASHQPAAAWGEFDPTLHMTYEYPGASGREDEPQRVLFRCSIHGHVTLGDGSVQHWPNEQSAVTPQSNEILRRRYGLGGAASRPVQSAEDTLNTISNNLRQIDGAKQQWALENRKSQSAQPTEGDVAVYLRDGIPAPVAGERYEINAVDQSPAAVLSQPIGPHQAGERFIVCPDGMVMTGNVARIDITRDGNLTVNGGPMDLEGLTEMLKEMPDDIRAATLIELQGDESEYSRIIAVLNACQEARITRIKLGVEPKSVVTRETSRLDGEVKSLYRELQANQQEHSRITRELASYEPAIIEARAKQQRAQEGLEALGFAADRLPAVVGQDERYQRLKAEYETAVLDGDEAARKRTFVRLQEWVDKIYRPELEAEAQLADHRLASVVGDPQEMLLQRRALEARGADQQRQRHAWMDRLRYLESLLNQTP